MWLIRWIGLMGSHLLIETNRIIKNFAFNWFNYFIFCCGQCPIGAGDGGGGGGQIGRTLRALNSPREEKPKSFQMEQMVERKSVDSIENSKNASTKTIIKEKIGKVVSRDAWDGRWEGVAASFSSDLFRRNFASTSASIEIDYLSQSMKREKSEFQMNSNLASGLRSSRSAIHVNNQMRLCRSCIFLNEFLSQNKHKRSDFSLVVFNAYDIRISYSSCITYYADSRVPFSVCPRSADVSNTHTHTHARRPLSVKGRSDNRIEEDLISISIGR